MSSSVWLIRSLVSLVGLLYWQYTDTGLLFWKPQHLFNLNSCHVYQFPFICENYENKKYKISKLLKYKTFYIIFKFK